MGSSGGLSKSYKKFLDDLRESGETNMFGATAYIMEEFGLTRHSATEVVNTWMKEFRKDD
jgi:hypothetical protein|tara:strand:- start:10 stop:189 length:180 start_codon:yes stop_codon:yes gene_type:complete